MTFIENKYFLPNEIGEQGINSANKIIVARWKENQNESE